MYIFIKIGDEDQTFIEDLFDLEKIYDWTKLFECERSLRAIGRESGVGFWGGRFYRTQSILKYIIINSGCG